MNLHDAKLIADEVVRAVLPSCHRAEVAGSIRREKPEVKDIEVVAVVADYDQLFSALRRFGRFIKPGVSEIVDWEPKVGAKYVRMLLHSGVKLDLFVASEDNWGSIFFMRTGSATGKDGKAWNAFVPQMFHRWKVVSGGGMMSGGMPTLPDGTQLPCYEESDFFDLVGVEFIPPSERTSASVIKKYVKV